MVAWFNLKVCVSTHVYLVFFWDQTIETPLRCKFTWLKWGRQKDKTEIWRMYREGENCVGYQTKGSSGCLGKSWQACASRKVLNSM